MVNSSLNIIYLLVISLLPLNLAGQSKDSSTLHNLPEISISFFNDGARSGKARIKLVVNGVETKGRFKEKFMLDTFKLSEKDLIKFRIYYKKYSMETQEYKANLFFNGGSIIAGVISDYFSEKNKYLSQEEYFLKNVKNKRDLVMRRVDDSVTSSEHKPLLMYSVINWKLTEQIMIRWNFFDRF